MKTIYLQATPSLKKRKTTKASVRRLQEENARRKKRGEAPLDSLNFKKLDKERVRSKSNMPDYRWTPRQDRTKEIPSHGIGNVSPDATSRETVMDKVLSGKITGDAAKEIIRKSKCLAPAFSKGAYQYISSEDSAKDAGRKK